MPDLAKFQPLLNLSGGLIILGCLVFLFRRALARSPSNFKIWVGGAISAFVGGFLEGCPIGSPVGAGTALADGQVYGDLRGRHILIELAHILAVPALTGLSDVRTYTKATPFPNLFSPPPSVLPGAPPDPAPAAAAHAAPAAEPAAQGATGGPQNQGALT